MTTTHTLNPFPGLRPFRTDEAHLFFGREGQIDEVLDKLEMHRFVAILGTSGSGKSSFMYCGLIPSLHGGFMSGTGSNWRVVTTRPGLSPIENLASALFQSASHDAADDTDIQLKKEFYLALLKGSSMGLVDVVKNDIRERDEHFLILVDQFEELFRFQRADEDPEMHANLTTAFIKLLLRAVEQREVPIHVVLTMRSDYIGDCAHYPELTRLINDSHYLIPQMNRDQKRTAILGPVAVGGAEISPRLTQQLLNDLGDNPDQLPIMQHALMRTWDFWRNAAGKDQESSLDLFHYEAIGGMSQALSNHANEAYNDLSDRLQIVCEGVFKCLTERGIDGRGVRRPTRMGQIAAIIHADEEEVRQVVEVFRAPGRTLLTPAANVTLRADTVIDISHESLMRIWVRLREWVEEEHEAVKMYLRMSEAAQMYHNGNAGLWRPPDLQVALNWREKVRPNEAWASRYDGNFVTAMHFLDNSQKAYEDEQLSKERQQKAMIRRTRIIAFVLGIAAIISIFFLIFAQLQRIRADEARTKAEELRQQAEQEKDRADSLRVLAGKEAEAARMAKEAAEASRDTAEMQKAIAERAKNEAVRNLREAKRQEDLAKANEQQAKDNLALAETQKQRADDNAKEAEKQRDAANASAKAANELRYLSVAKSMAIKSLQLEDTLKLLVAKQAHKFHSENGGYEYDTDVYDGLYYATKELQSKDEEADRTTKAHRDAVRRVFYARDGKTFFTTGSDGQLLRWTADGKGNNSSTILSSKIEVYRSSDFDAKDMRMVVGTDEGKVILLDLQNGQPIYEQMAHPGAVVKGVWDVCLVRGKDYFYTVGADMTIRRHHFRKGTMEDVVKSKEGIRAIAVHPVSGDLIAALLNGKIVRWKADATAQPYEVLFEEKARNEKRSRGTRNTGNLVRFSPDGRWLAAGFENGSVQLYDYTKSEVSYQLSGHSAWITDIQFSPNGQFVATASMDKTAQVWNMQRLNEAPIVLRDQTDWAWTVAFSTDNQKVVVGCQNGQLHNYPFNIRQMADQLCGHLSRNLSTAEWQRFVGEGIEPQPACQK